MLERIQSDDRLFAMPTTPPVPYSKLAEGDSLRTLVSLLKEWSETASPTPSTRS